MIMMFMLMMIYILILIVIEKYVYKMQSKLAPTSYTD
jgi:hypothetical protein